MAIWWTRLVALVALWFHSIFTNKRAHPPLLKPKWIRRKEAKREKKLQKNRLRKTSRIESKHNFYPKDTGAAMESDIYNDTALQQYEVVEKLLRLPIFGRSLERLEMDKIVLEKFVLADFGVSGGKACVLVVRTIQECFDLKPTLYLNDREENDWDVTLRTINEGLGDSVTAKCLKKDMFQSQDIPPGSCHIGFTTTALQWLSNTPSEFTTGTNAGMRQRNDPHRVKWAMQARKDLHNFCVHRAAEMAPGGILFLCFPCLNSEDSPDQIRLADMAFSEAKHRLVLQGILTEDDEKTLVIPEFYRSERETFEVLNSREMKKLWEVLEKSFLAIEDPWLAALKRKEISPKQCAEMQTKATRSYNDGIVRSKIKSKEKRETLWKELETICKADPWVTSHKTKFINIALQRKG